MKKKISKFVYWTPRILSIIFIFFLALMSLDGYSPELSFWQTLGALFMHNIPTLILLAVLLISWKYEIVGGIAFSKIILVSAYPPVNRLDGIYGAQLFIYKTTV